MKTYEIEMTIWIEADTEETAEEILTETLGEDLGIKDYKIHSVLEEKKNG